MMNKLLKFFLITLGVLGGFYLFIHIIFDGIFTGLFYDKNDLIENYEQRKEEILDVKNYFQSILPENASVSIEFNNNRELGSFHVMIDSVYQDNWDVKINSPKVDSLMNKLKWTIKELRILKEKLDKANCISIAGKDPVTIGWQRSGMGKFSYTIFEQNLSEKEIEQYNNGCTYIFYKENVVLEYGGGVIGPQCFSDFYQNKEKNEKGR